MHTTIKVISTPACGRCAVNDVWDTQTGKVTSVHATLSLSGLPGALGRETWLPPPSWAEFMRIRVP